MSIRSPKQALFEQFAAVAKALGNPQRLARIMHERGADWLAGMAQVVGLA